LVLWMNWRMTGGTGGLRWQCVASNCHFFLVFLLLIFPSKISVDMRLMLYIDRSPPLFSRCRRTDYKIPQYCCNFGVWFSESFK